MIAINVILFLWVSVNHKAFSLISKHIGISYRTLLYLSPPLFSAIIKHVNIFDHKNYFITPKEFKIIARGQNDLKLLIKESTLIKHLKPNLNNVDYFSLDVFIYFFVLIELMYV